MFAFMVNFMGLGIELEFPGNFPSSPPRRTALNEVKQKELRKIN